MSLLAAWTIDMTILGTSSRALACGITVSNQAALHTCATSQPASLARHHRDVVIGAGAAGLSLSHQFLRSGNFAPKDIAVVDPA